MKMILDVVSGVYTTLVGMMVTGRELFRRPTTVKYPYEKREIPTRFRGMVVNDVTTCNACTKCVRVCPVDCIDMKGVGKGKDRKSEYWKLDYSKCCWCQLCVEVCPDGSLQMSHEFELVFKDRKNMVRDFVTDPIPPFVDKSPQAGYEKEEFWGGEK